MSDEKKNTEAEQAGTDAAEITTLNSHATSEPIKPLNSHATIAPLKLTAEGGTATATDGGTIATPDNSHATGETV